MVDIVSPEKRSQMMAGIRSRDTKPEIAVRRELHKRGFRFRLHRKDICGRPDLYLPRYKSTIFVHGCFWHGHDCKIFKLPEANRDFWVAKIRKNQERDSAVFAKLTAMGLRTRIIWECQTRAKPSDFLITMDEVAKWLTDPDC